MCSPNELKQALRENNKLRDLNLENQLSKLRESIFDHIQDVLSHNTTAPTTEAELNKIKSECSVRATTIALLGQSTTSMKEDLNELKKDNKEIKQLLNDLLQKENKKYAPMASWTIMKWMGGIFFSALILWLFDRWFNLPVVNVVTEVAK